MPCKNRPLHSTKRKEKISSGKLMNMFLPNKVISSASSILPVSLVNKGLYQELALYLISEAEV